MARTLRFHRSLYSEEAIREAMEVYGEHGDFELTEAEPYACVKVEVTAEGLDEGRLVGELGNHALARSVEQRRAQ